VGRLENITQRNRHPWKLKGIRGIVVPVFVLVILVMMMFTDWGSPPPDTRPGINIVPAKDGAVRGVKLYRAPSQPRPADQVERP